MTNNNAPMIYVACLSAYNSGYLHGEWVDATQDVELIEKEIQEILNNSPVCDPEEWAIHDYDNFYAAGSFLGEYPGLEKVSKVARFIEDAGEIGAKLIGHYGDIDYAIAIYENGYAGCHESLGDFAEEISRESGNEVPKWLEGCIDWEKMGESWEMSGDVTVIETGFQQQHIFWNAH